MSVVPLQIARVSNQLRSSLLLGTLQKSQVGLLKTQNQIGTGEKYNRASEDPAAALSIARLRRQMESSKQFEKNLDFAAGFLNIADTSLGVLNDLVTQAKAIASSQLGVGSSPSERMAQAAVVESLINRAYSLSNRTYQGTYIFSGQNGTQEAFQLLGGGYKYNGSTSGQGILTPDGSTIEFTMNGDQVFGGLSSQVVGYRDLSPAITSSTRLADLNGATLAGVRNGAIDVTVGATTLAVDLTSAATVGDVVTLVNNALSGAGATASLSLSGGRFVVNGDASDSVTISDTANGTMAADLGINGTVAAAGTLNGAAVGAKITPLTTIASLRGGMGIDPAGISISNGGSAATVSLTGVTTVEDLLNKINTSGTNVRAEINASGTGINLFNPISGAALRVGENGGSTADQLGIRSFQANTNLNELNFGGGITPISGSIPGPAGSLMVTKTDGTTFAVRVDGVRTASQLIAAINTAAGNGTVTAAVNATGNGITLTDSSGGAGNIAVVAGSDYVSNGSDLGILKSGSGATLSGTNITFSTDDFRITRRDGSSFTVNLTGAATVQDVLDRINNADGNTTPGTAVTASLNPSGNGIRLADASAGTGTLTVSPLNASPVASQLGILQASTGGVITGSDVNPLQPRGVFSSLALLRDALLSNDDGKISRAAQLLEEDGARAILARGTVGARVKDIESRKDDLSTDLIQAEKSLEAVAGTDMTEAITRYQMLQTSYEASLKVASTTQNLSLLDFLR